MTAEELINALNILAPPSYAMEWDNPGLLVGDKTHKVDSVYLALDASVLLESERVVVAAYHQDAADPELDQGVQPLLVKFILDVHYRVMGIEVVNGYGAGIRRW